MDNKITKKRLSNFLAYEWIAIIATVVAVIILWELIFTVSAVKVKEGQRYYFMTDYYVTASKNSEFMGLTNGVLSYDVLEYSSEQVQDASDDMLKVRYDMQEVDSVFSYTNGLTDGTDRAKNVIDNLEVYNYERLYLEAKEYLYQFVLEELKFDQDELSDKEKYSIALNFDNLDKNKIDENFLIRMDGDNRFRSDEEKASGKALERERIEKLINEVKDFEKLIYSEQDIFFNYTRFEQTYQANPSAENERIYNYEISQGRGNAIYGIDLGKLPTNSEKAQASNFFSVEKSANNVVLLVFNLKSYQTDLEYESIAFINQTVRIFSTVLD